MQSVKITSSPVESKAITDLYQAAKSLNPLSRDILSLIICYNESISGFASLFNRKVSEVYNLYKGADEYLKIVYKQKGNTNSTDYNYYLKQALEKLATEEVELIEKITSEHFCDHEAVKVDIADFHAYRKKQNQRYVLRFQRFLTRAYNELYVKIRSYIDEW